MKSCEKIFSVAGAFTVLLALNNVRAAEGPAGRTARASKPASALSGLTNAPVPKSVYSVPDKPAEGKDPFFPDLWQQQAAVQTKPAQRAPVAVLTFQGVSGSAERQLAIINGFSFAIGEEGEVPVAGGRVKIRCIDIRTNEAVIEVSGQRQRLKLGGGTLPP
jgi:hypothetical protein